MFFCISEHERHTNLKKLIFGQISDFEMITPLIFIKEFILDLLIMEKSLLKGKFEILILNSYIFFASIENISEKKLLHAF